MFASAFARLYDAAAGAGLEDPGSEETGNAAAMEDGDVGGAVEVPLRASEAVLVVDTQGTGSDDAKREGEMSPVTGASDASAPPEAFGSPSRLRRDESSNGEDEAESKPRAPSQTQQQQRKPRRQASAAGAMMDSPSETTGSLAGGVGLDVVMSQRSYFAGDVVKCRIYLYFPESRRSSVFLEWASAQVHGHVAFDPHLVSPHDAAEVAEEEGAGFDPQDREKRLRHAHESGVLHRAEDSMRVLHKSGSVIQVGKIAANEPQSRSGRYGDLNLAGLDGYADTIEFLEQACTFTTQSMPDVSLLAGKYGSCLFASPPEVVACAVEGRPGHEMAFAFEATLPEQIPPSYKGSAARYFYVMSVGVKLGCNRNAQVLHIPIRICSTIGASVLPDQLPGSRTMSFSDASEGSSSSGSRLRSFSSFLLEEHDFQVGSWVLGETNFRRRPGSRSEKFSAASYDVPLFVNPRPTPFRVVDFDCTGLVEQDLIDSAMEQSAAIIARSSSVSSSSSSSSASSQAMPSASSAVGRGRGTRTSAGKRRTRSRTLGEQIFRIGSESKHLAHLHMFKDAATPGEQILLSFDFADAKVPCYQITVALEIEERSKCPAPLLAALDPLTSLDSRGAPSRQPAVRGSSDAFGVGPWTRVLVSQTVQTVFNVDRTVILTIPVDATPDFETDLISVQSYLRFEFVTARPQGNALTAANGGPPGDVFPVTNGDTQTSPWRIPLRIFPPSEHEHLQLPRQYTAAAAPAGPGAPIKPGPGSGQNGESSQQQHQPRQHRVGDTGILLLSSSTQASMLHVRVWL